MDLPQPIKDYLGSLRGQGKKFKQFTQLGKTRYYIWYSLIEHEQITLFYQDGKECKKIYENNEILDTSNLYWDEFKQWTKLKKHF